MLRVNAVTRNCVLSKNMIDVFVISYKTPSKEEVRQSGCLSSLLFTISIDELIRSTKTRIKPHMGTYYG